MKHRLYLSLICVSLTLSACGGNSTPSGSTSKALGNFKAGPSCEEIKQYVQEFAKRSKQYPGGVVPMQSGQASDVSSPDQGATAAGSDQPEAAPSAASVTQSDIAVADQDRGLILLTDHSKNFLILRTSPTGQAGLLSKTPLDFYVTELLQLQVSGKSMAVLFGSTSTVYNYGGGPVPVATTEGDSMAPQPFEEPKSVMAVFDVSDPQHPLELKRETSPGYFVEARALNQKGSVLWLSQRNIPTYLENISDGEIFPQKEIHSKNGDSSEALSPCSSHYLYQNETLDSDYSPYSLQETLVSFLDLTQESLAVSSQSLLSPAWRSILNVNTEHLFLAQNIDGAERSDTELFQFDLPTEGPSLSLHAGTQVPGNIPNQFFIDESSDVIRVFHHVQNFSSSCMDCAVSGGTGSSGSAGAEPGKALEQNNPTGNYLSTYQVSGNSLELIGRSGPFETTESPYAARFMNSVGCVITFRQIDPLTCFSLKDASHPQPMGALQIEGVSFHLEAVNDQLLLGIGQGSQASGVVANLFDVSDPTHPKLADQENLSPGSQWASSPVFYDFRALGKDEQQNQYAVPVDDSANSFIQILQVDPAQKTLSLGGKVTKALNLDEGSFDSYQRAFFFSDSLAALSFQNLEVLARSGLNKVFSQDL